MKTSSRAAVLAAAAASVLLVGCRSQRTPDAPRVPGRSKLEVLEGGGAPALRPYLDAYPLGDDATRVDLLASSKDRSMHLVQTRRAISRHYHPARTEIVYVLTGTGTCYLGDRSYPIAPGSTFRIAPGIVHSALPGKGQTIVAVSYFEPPLVQGDDRVVVEESGPSR